MAKRVLATAVAGADVQGLNFPDAVIIGTCTKSYNHRIK